VKATLILCDYAVVSEGKLYISGGGWSMVGPGPSPAAIGILIAVPWDRANHPIKMVLRLEDSDGQPVTQSGPLGDEPVQVAGELEIGRPPGLKPGTPLNLPLAINFGAGIPGLVPGRRYAWRLHLDDESREDWDLPFDVRPLPAT
jgi:hypothetical protein